MALLAHSIDVCLLYDSRLADALSVALVNPLFFIIFKIDAGLWQA